MTVAGNVSGGDGKGRTKKMMKGTKMHHGKGLAVKTQAAVEELWAEKMSQKAMTEMEMIQMLTLHVVQPWRGISSLEGHRQAEPSLGGWAGPGFKRVSAGRAKRSSDTARTTGVPCWPKERKMGPGANGRAGREGDITFRRFGANGADIASTEWRSKCMYSKKKPGGELKVEITFHLGQGETQGSPRGLELSQQHQHILTVCTFKQ